jgi:transposase
MNPTLLLSSPTVEHTPGQEWHTPARAKVRLLRKSGYSYGAISKHTGLTRSTIQRIVKAKSSRRSRKGKEFKPKLLKAHDIRRLLRYVCASWSNRRASYSQLKATLRLDASTTTIRRTLRAHGYRRCVACPRPFINKKQAAERLAFARKYRWWGTRDWAQVLWSDEATFETGKRGRVYVTRRPDEKRCNTCIKSVYRSGRTSVMI